MSAVDGAYAYGYSQGMSDALALIYGHGDPVGPVGVIGNTTFDEPKDMNDVVAEAMAKRGADKDPEPDPEVVRIERFLDQHEIDPLWSVNRTWDELGGVAWPPEDTPLIEKVQSLRQLKALAAQGGGDV